jgi:pimeloyl-ACP methyl ester carboxylesterase/DNA-binding CsgD family transcriptional regulator
LIKGLARGDCEFEQFVETLMPLIKGTDPIDLETQLELSTALIAFEKTATRDDRLYALVNDEGSATVALGESGQILALNPAAAALFSASTGDGLSALKIDQTSFMAFKRRLATCAGPTLIKAFLESSRRQYVPVLLTGSYYPRFRAFVLAELRGTWPPSIDLAMEELFGLSRSEREILASLARGLDSDGIARERGRSVGTVRQQVKAILSKLGTSSQLAAATLAATAAGVAAELADGNSAGMLPITTYEAPLLVYSFERDGRRVGFRRFGHSSGAPVLFLHGPSFGAGEYPEDRRLAERLGLCVYALERPGYGRTDPAPDSEDPLVCEYLDAMALFRLRKPGPVHILAHEAALIPALELARKEPGLVRGILGVSSAPPFLQLEQLAEIPANHGVYFHAARHAPWIAQLLVKILTVRMRRLGPQAWTEVIFKGQSFETAVMSRPALAPGIIGTYSFYLNQQGAGFEHELRIMLDDWSTSLAEVQVPLVLVHGARNNTTPPAHLDIFRKIRPDISIELVADAGLSLAVSHPRLVYERLSGLVRTSVVS